MIRSMTGFGTATANYLNKTITVEIKSVNSKFFDLMLRLPSIYKEKEYELRTDLSRTIERGKVDFSITIDSVDAIKKTSINPVLFKAYYDDLRSIQDKYNTGESDLMRIVLGLPDVMSNDKQALSEEEWNVVTNTIELGLSAFHSFRLAEGASMQKDLEERINSIVSRLTEIEKFEGGRIEQVRKRLTGSLEEFIQTQNIDRNRIEQELIFYVEKFDISEEKVRLRTHCNYFLETIKSDASNGKKLAFISQEIGREINTIGSKANDAEMQKIVVNLKDELEKIKELLLNVL
ncbi:MAG TPA: YicC family protein [Bacteroidia bacterium]|nr:YicC family protein [Bacteroidia bacterium]HNS11975.1 YicC family protein [Bacteroidia bacterium]